MATKKAKTQAKSKGKIEKAEEFAYAYIRHLGNGTAAAREVYELEGMSASVQASKLLRNPKVQEIVSKYLDAQRDAFKKFTEQGGFFLTVVSQKLIDIIQDEETSIHDCFAAMERLLRLGGFEVAEGVTIAKMQAREAARGRAILPGLPGPGTQPGVPQGNVDNSRKTIFLLSPPPVPPGGTPTPALFTQWAEQLGFRPGVAESPRSGDNAADGKSAHPHSVPRRR